MLKPSTTTYSTCSMPALPQLGEHVLRAALRLRERDQREGDQLLHGQKA